MRHHSPAAARLLAEFIEERRPAAVLIEGPSDFQPYFAELHLPHELPIAIYSYFRTDEGDRRGAYYPFSEYSPEWQAITHAAGLGIEARFIDLPWAEVADLDRVTHRYADAELRRGRYVRAVCDRLGVEDFDDLWDKIVEADGALDLADYLRRVHWLCWHTRLWEAEISQADQRREVFMAGQIAAALEECSGQALVVTGGFHSSALAARLEGFACPGTEPVEPAESPPSFADRGIALTTYSYERLDNLAGYDAGMPSPGFYDHAWQSQSRGESFSHAPLVRQIVAGLRSRKQTVSTADLIALETSARALAALRGRERVWRRRPGRRRHEHAGQRRIAIRLPFTTAGCRSRRPAGQSPRHAGRRDSPTAAGRRYQAAVGTGRAGIVARRCARSNSICSRRSIERRAGCCTRWPCCRSPVTSTRAARTFSPGKI